MVKTTMPYSALTKSESQAINDGVTLMIRGSVRLDGDFAFIAKPHLTPPKNDKIIAPYAINAEYTPG